MKYDVITSGYVSMDHIIRIATPAQVGLTSIVTNPDCVKTNYGGCGPNIAIALCKLGKKALPVLRVGPDWETNGFKKYLEDCSVSLDATEVLENEATSTCFLLQDSNGDHITIFYPGSMDKKYAHELRDEYFENTRLGVMTVASMPDNRYFLDQCKKHDVPVIFGMKDDFDAFPADFLKEILEESSIIFTNEVERELIEKMYGYSSMEDLFRIGKAQIIVTTLGKKGSICYEKTSDGIREYHVPPCQPDVVVDATGAGDSYMTGFIYGYLNGKSIPECCQLGAGLAYFVLGVVGCTTGIPTPEALEAKAKEIVIS